MAELRLDMPLSVAVGSVTMQTVTTSSAKMSGPKARFRGKLRDRPFAITLTPEGHAALAAGTTRTGLSRADYIETLLRDADRKFRL